MDPVTFTGALRSWGRKYRTVLVVVLAGILLMLLPGKEKVPPQAAPEPEVPAMEEQLERILSRMSGAGKVEVLLTVALGEQTFYEGREERRDEEYRREPVVVTGENRGQNGLVRRVDPPRYRGAVILAQGADRAGVRLAITQAVSAATGLGADQIAVMKMN